MVADEVLMHFLCSDGCINSFSPLKIFLPLLNAVFLFRSVACATLAYLTVPGYQSILGDAGLLFFVHSWTASLVSTQK